AWRNPVTRRWVSCGKISQTASDQAGSLCGKANCILSQKGGTWICCRCKFGYKGIDRNRYSECANTDCQHDICNDCLPWTRETVRAMIEAEENEPSSSPEPLSPSEQEYWDSDESDSDAVEEADE